MSQKRSTWTWFLFAVPMVLLMYVLSVGPAIWLANHWTNETYLDAIVAFYTPLDWVSERVPPFDRAMAWYIRLFEPEFRLR